MYVSLLRPQQEHTCRLGVQLEAQREDGRITLRLLLHACIVALENCVCEKVRDTVSYNIFTVCMCDFLFLQEQLSSSLSVSFRGVEIIEILKFVILDNYLFETLQH